MTPRFILGATLSAVALVQLAPTARALSFTNFSEFGTTVNGYQDDFNGATLNPDWLDYNAGSGPAAHFTLSGTGTLLMHPANGDPNKLLYNPAVTYDNTVQNVLALIRVTTDAANADGVRGGLAGVSNSTDGQGVNLLFRQPGQNGNGNHFNLLDDARSWGPATDPNTGGESWTTGSYKWLRLVHDATGSFGKIWDAGAGAEPAGFNLSWDSRNRTGLAGLATNSIGGANEFEVDYFLLQASGLPSTQVVPEPGTGLLALLGAGALGLARRRRG